MFVVRCLLLVGGCFVARCAMFVVRCWMCVAWCLLFDMRRCSLSAVAC